MYPVNKGEQGEKGDSGECNCDGVNTKSLHLDNYFLSDAYPNPAKGNCKIDYKYPYKLSNAKLVLYDYLGKKRLIMNLDSFEGVLEINSNLLSRGIFNYRIESGKYSSSCKKLIVE